MTTKTKTNTVAPASVTVDTTGFEAFVALDKRYDIARETARELGRDVSKSVDALLLLTQAPYNKMDAKKVKAHFKLDVTEDTVKKYVLAARVMRRLVRGDDDTCLMVYRAVGKAIAKKETKTKKGYGLDAAEARLDGMPAGSTWGDWAKVVKDDIARLNNYGLPSSASNIKANGAHMTDSQQYDAAVGLMACGWTCTPPSK